MDDSTLLVGGLGILGTLAAAWKRRSEGAAAQDSAGAAAIAELIVQIGAVRRDLERETAARIQLQEHVDRLENALVEAETRAAHLSGQVHILTLEKAQAEQWARALAEELAELRRQIQGSHTVPSSVPKR